MKFHGLEDANNKPFGRLLPVEIQVIIMLWASVAETNDKRKKVLAQLVRIPVCRNTHIPKYVKITRQGFQRWYRTVLVPFGNLNQGPHCSRRQEQQVSIDMIATIDKNNETALYDARIAHILQLFRLSHPNIPLHRLPAHGLKRLLNIQDYHLDVLLTYFNYRYSHRPNSLLITY
ncbi:hypothetical protein ABFA07_007951 [Porites harrisoni]